MYVCAWSRWRWRLCPGGFKGNAGAALCHLLCHCIRVVSHHLLGRVQIHTHTHTHLPTQMYTNTQAWRVEMKYPPHQLHSETWRPRPRDRDRTSDHMTPEYRGAPVLFCPPPPFLKRQRSVLGAKRKKQNKTSIFTAFTDPNTRREHFRFSSENDPQRC